MAKEKARLDKEIARNRGKLANAGFLGKAPPEIVAKVEADLRSALTKAGELETAEMRKRLMNRLHLSGLFFHSSDIIFLDAPGQ